MRRFSLLFVLMFALGIGSARATIALVAHTYVNNGTTPAINTTGATLLVIAASAYGGMAAPTDSKGNSWAKINTYTGDTQNVTIYYAYNPIVGASHTFSVARSYENIFVSAWSGTSTASTVLDAHNGYAPFDVSMTSIQPGSITPAMSGELIITVLGTATNATGYAIDSSFTILDQQTAALEYGADAYLIDANANAINPKWSWTTSQYAAACIASFKPASAQNTGRAVIF